MKFIIDLDGCTPCFPKNIMSICRSKGYNFLPKNKNYYLVDTDTKECIGVDIPPSGYEIYSDKTSFIVIKKIFK